VVYSRPRNIHARLELLAVLQYDGISHIDALTAMVQNDIDEARGEAFSTPHIVATGTFSNLHHLSMIVVASLTICAVGLIIPQLGLFGLALKASIAFPLYAPAL